MNSLEDRVIKHLDQILGTHTETTPWADSGHLPRYLRARYRFAECRLLSRPTLLVLDDSADPETPAAIKSQLENLAALWSDEVVYVRSSTTSFHRKQLVEQRIPFIIPGNQIYLPTMGFDLREHFRGKKQANRKKFRPSTQAVFLYALLREDPQPLVAGKIAPILGYAPMTLSRAFDELEAAGLASSQMEARERRLILFADRKVLWDNARPHLIDPVHRRLNVYREPKGPRLLWSGESALSHLTMLGPPKNPTYAMSQEYWTTFSATEEAVELPEAHPDYPCVEIWKYTPREHLIPGLVDPLSLFLSFGNSDDARIAQALTDLATQFPWQHP